jgi:hypothetical protein
MILRGLKEYAQAEEVSAGFGVDLELASDLFCRIGESETAEYWEKVQCTSMGPHIDLVPGKNGTGTCLTRADTGQGGTWLRSLVLLTSVAPPSLYFDLRLTILIDHE